MNKAQKSAAMIAIGDELLSGRTRDATIYHLPSWLTARGVKLKEVRIIADEEDQIINAVNALRAEADYVFTSGGIGPTHDDITATSIAKAFQLSLIEDAAAVEVLTNWYEGRGEELTKARRRMTCMPQGASLIENPVSGAPGFIIENVFVTAGVPKIFQGMLADIDQHIEHGPISVAYSVRAPAIESILSAGLEALQRQNEELSIGSYPGKSGMGGEVTLVIRGIDEGQVKSVAEQVLSLVTEHGFEGVLMAGDGSNE